MSSKLHITSGSSEFPVELVSCLSNISKCSGFFVPTLVAKRSQCNTVTRHIIMLITNIDVDLMVSLCVIVKPRSTHSMKYYEYSILSFAITLRMVLIDRRIINEPLLCMGYVHDLHRQSCIYSTRLCWYLW